MRRRKLKENRKYIILEIIPTAISPEKGPIAQLSALKLEGLTLLDRFDYRLEEELIYNRDILQMINYDKKSFTYVDSGADILEKFRVWAEDFDLFIIDNEYTNNYLKGLDNKKESILKYLGFQYSDDVIDKIIKKYQLEPSNHIVDLLYEGLIYASNHRK